MRRPFSSSGDYRTSERRRPFQLFLRHHPGKPTRPLTTSATVVARSHPRGDGTMKAA